jgi:hypothetical protein
MFNAKRFLYWLVAFFCIQGAAAAAHLALNRTIVPPSGTITITGSGFPANSIVDVYLDLQQVAFEITTRTGGFVYVATVPASHKPGAHTITVMLHSGTGAVAHRTFLVRTDWTSWRGEPYNRGWNRAENVLNSTNVREADYAWTGPRPVLHAPVISGENFYFIGSGTGGLYAYDRKSRALKFVASAAARALVPPAVSGSYAVVVTTSAYNLATYNSSTGALIWKAILPAGLGAPTIYGGKVYVIAEGSPNAGLYVFSLTCGTGGAICSPLWRSVAGSTSSYNAPEPGVAIGERKVYASLGGTLYAYPLDCVTPINICAPSASRAGVNDATPVFSNGYVYITSGTRLLALDAKCIGCAPKWTATLSTVSKLSPTVAAGRVYVADGDVLRVFPTGCGSTTCAQIGATTVAQGSPHSPTYANGVLYLPTAREALAYSGTCVSSCTPLWSAAGGSPGTALYAGVSVVDGTIYVPGSGGLKIFEIPKPRSALKAPVDVASLRPDPRFAAAEAAWEKRLAALRR